FNLNYFNIILVSLCAGIGEEIFFRAALQPIIGIWPTAIIFVILHCYINPRNWRISIYGFFMIIIMLGIGYLYETVGLISVMVAHTVIDIILFYMLMNKRKEFSNEYTDPLRD
ncbi:MAG: CPBP family intramembrane metalloprotease, partial [Bacteroidota bacterium]|nr:CPBP family intramembrane metalloprotease [Bacteroidota bacterium]